ncbi:Homeodomain-like superfamily protein [Dorcoceras hygrometricum]|uniref:Homeodomain-like superfamily protein n=1 Tax=Dorcoceras hygrometricum TaxID=472368 RepID=A0A2Z7BMK6_9LAMI|nr:Homeodomain-like superfamily protein [Dorcoceras hygrometricum]
MESSKDDQLELVLSKRSATSYLELLEAQNDLFHSQIGKLQNIVATQCKLTGINPLSQEMAAGALSIKIGKRPRDLLNPKAVKYLQFVFSIKDAVSKRETREISAQFGVTASQVREFFTGQRSRVRNFVRLSGKNADRSRTCDESRDGTPSTSYPNVSAEPVPIDTVAPSSHEGPSRPMQTEVVPLGKEKSDRHFMDNIFRLMRSEESFSGQDKLLEWILQIENISVLHWFLVQGGVMILATWLSQAAVEEQTSVLNNVLKVLCHLPLRKALPVHMSAILQSVNKLRFYRASDISNRARYLLSMWSKMFASSQSSNKLNGNKSVGDGQDEMLLKQRQVQITCICRKRCFKYIKEVMDNEIWDSNVDYSEADLRITNGNANSFRKLESPQKLKLLTPSGEESNKRRGVVSSQIRERRKVKLVEPPGQRIVANSPHIVKSTPATYSRPLSADDIQKAKMRTQFMQSKYSKTDDNSQVKSDSPHNCSTSQSNVPQSIPKPVRADLDERKELDNAAPKVSNIRETTHSNLEEPPLKKVKRIPFTWRTPREVKLMESWLVGIGESSKEVEVQKNRIRREREITYRTNQEIPSNPREPWDREMDYDDTLTPEIPIEQLPDVEPLETPQASVNGHEGSVDAVSTTLSGAGGSVPEPDLELLAELLKNPEIVYALTSGQAGDLSSNETCRLLDMIKVNGMTSLSNFAGSGAKGDNKVEVSLPSPTPSSDLVPNGVKRDLTRNPFSRQQTTAKGNVFQSPETAHIPGPSVFVSHPSPASSLQSTLQSQQCTNILMHNKSSNVHHLAPEMLLKQNTAINSNRASTSLLRVENFGNINMSPASLGISSTRLLPSPTPTPLHPQLPYTRESTIPHSLSARPGYETINYHQKNPTINNVGIDGPVHAALPARTWERNGRAVRPEYESWSPENSQHRHFEYIPGQNHPEPRVDIRRERAMPRNSVQSSGFRDQRMSGVRDYRR